MAEPLRVLLVEADVVYRLRFPDMVYDYVSPASSGSRDTGRGRSTPSASTGSS